MYLKSIRIANYRVHKQVSVDFDRYLTLIGGPNESGKSTLIEAAHRVLFLKARSSGERQKEMCSNFSSEPPEVELTFAKQGIDFTISKIFAAGKGTSQLRSSHGWNFRNEEAEEKLSELLGVTLERRVQSAETLQQTWGHLWVWQGTSTRDPFKQVDSYRDDLISRLQTLGVAGLLQSDLDSRAILDINKMTDSIFTNRDAFKTSSAVANAEKELKEADALRQSKRARCQTLQLAAEQYDQADREYRATEEQIRKQREQLGITREQQKQANLLKERLILLENKLNERRKELKSIENAQLEHAKQRNLRDKAEKQIGLKSLELAALQESHQNTKTEILSRTKELEDIRRQLRYAKLLAEVERTAQKLQEAETSEVQLQKILQKIAGCREEQSQLESQRAKIPAIDAKSVQKLHQLDTAVQKAEATRNAMAASVQLLHSDASVYVGEQTLQPGDEVLLSTPTEITIGSHTKILVTPGGGSSLAEAQQSLSQAQQKWTDQLDKLKVRSLAEAQDFFQQRTELDKQIEQLKSTLREHGADTFLDTYNQAQEQTEQLRTAVTQSKTILETFLSSEPISPPQLLADQSWNSLIEHFEETQAIASRQLDKQRDQAELLHGQVTELGNQIKELERQRASANDGMHREEKVLGDPLQRELNIATLRDDIDKNDLEFTTIQREYLELNPDQLDNSIKRLDTAVANLQESVNSLRETRAKHLAQLQNDGSIDIYGEAATADAAFEFSQNQFDSLNREAQAWKLLKTLFDEEQKKLTDSLVEPLIQRIKKYAHCFTGELPKVSFDSTDRGFTELRIARPSDNNLPIDFDYLSGGAKEQIAAATRLAVAEVLASGSDDGLPIVFDDSFSYSDSFRLEAFPLMIERAVEAGLQVIVVTCNPLQYAALGAKTIQLTRSRMPN